MTDLHSPLLALPGATRGDVTRDVAAGAVAERAGDENAYGQNANGEDDSEIAGEAPDVDAAVAWHYGDPLGEQRAAERGAGLIDLSHRGLLAVTGPDRLTWLHALISQHVQQLGEGSATEALVLSAQGHVEHHVAVVELGGTTYLSTEPGREAALHAYLTSMIFWSKVEIADGSADLAQLRMIGPKARLVLAQAVQLPPTLPGSAAALPGGGFAVTAGKATFDLYVPRAGLRAIAAKLIAVGARPVGSWAAGALRIAARTPRWGLDTDERTIPNETSWLDTAVHLEKGCYRGQETVARVHNVGRPPRRLVLLHLDGTPNRLPRQGSALTTADGRVVGRVGTVAHHHQDGPIALGLVKRSVPPGTPLQADGVAALIDPDDLADQRETGSSEVPRSAVDRRAFADLRRR